MTMLEVVLLSLGLSSCAYILMGLIVEHWHTKRDKKAKEILRREMDRLRGKRL